MRQPGLWNLAFAITSRDETVETIQSVTKSYGYARASSAAARQFTRFDPALLVIRRAKS